MKASYICTFGIVHASAVNLWLCRCLSVIFTIRTACNTVEKGALRKALSPNAIQA